MKCWKMRYLIKNKYALCTFKNEIVSMDEMRSLLSMIEDSDGLVYESLKEEPPTSTMLY